jgi:fatty acid desaturase
MHPNRVKSWAWLALLALAILLALYGSVWAALLLLFVALFWVLTMAVKTPPPSGRTRGAKPRRRGRPG